MTPFLEELQRTAPLPISCYPNAGLPNAFGSYDETPQQMAATMREFAREGWVNLVGGCCGTTPRSSRRSPPRSKGGRRTGRSSPRVHAALGLEPLTIRPDSNFIVIGERTNVTGSKRFSRLITPATTKAPRGRARPGRGGRERHRRQLRRGPARLRGRDDDLPPHGRSEPAIAKLPIMVDSSKWSCWKRARVPPGEGDRELDLLKEGEEVFIARRGR
jgi:5-methyltetrahydrofolate--homocysteine methyltransferase